MKIGENIGNAPGPTPGNPKAVKQHQAIAQGYAAMTSERRVDTRMAGVGEKSGGTGGTSAPGLTSKPSMRRM